MRVFVSRQLPVDPAPLLGASVSLDVFAEDRPPDRDELIAGARGADAIVTLLSDRVDGELLDAIGAPRIVANYAVGYDNIDLEACRARGVWVSNTPDVLTEATADLTWALILAVARRVAEGERWVREGRFSHWSPTLLLGTELFGATLGLFGYGRIGRAVARRAEGFGMRVLTSSRSSGCTKDELCAAADVLSIHAPLDASTYHAFDAGAFRRMKPSAILINTARGPIVDEAALVAALDHGEIAGAGLDVYEEEPRVHPGLLGREDVVLLPHLGSATEHTRRRMAEIALGNVAAVLRGEKPPNALFDIDAE